MEKVMAVTKERAVVIFSKSSCCMSHSITVLFRELGVNPMVYQLDGDSEGREMETALMSLGCEPVVPTVFIGGVLVGSTRRVMSLHLEGSLKPMLKRARAIWLQGQEQPLVVLDSQRRET